MQQSYLVALFGAATGYGIMILAMTATPLAMFHHAHGLQATTTVIQLHVLGMFLPSFFTGSLIARFGVRRVMLSGVLLLVGHVLMTMSGTGFYSFMSALILLGVWWNFLYIGGTSLLTGTYSAFERATAQAFNDMTIFVIGVTCSFSVGGLLDTMGWKVLNIALLPWLALASLSLLWLNIKRRVSPQAVKSWSPFCLRLSYPSASCAAARLQHLRAICPDSPPSAASSPDVPASA